jgi:hypothetical protein
MEYPAAGSLRLNVGRPNDLAKWLNLRQLTGQSGREMGFGADGFEAQIDPTRT